MNHNKNQKSQIKILYWNVRSFLSKKLELQRIISSYDLIICVESWLKPLDTVFFPGFVTFRKDSIGTKSGGIIFLIKKHLAFHELSYLKSPHDSVELSGIRITNVSPVINILACYKAPFSNLSQIQWDSLIENVSLHNYSILVGDFNSHSQNWNCDKTGSHGTKLERSFDSYNLFLPNNNTYTHLDSYRNKKSNIYLLLSSLDLADKTNFQVCDENWGSDHYPIIFYIDAKKNIWANPREKSNSDFFS